MVKHVLSHALEGLLLSAKHKGDLGQRTKLSVHPY
jgi:hypothetical protein